MRKLTFIIAALAMLCIAATSRAQTPQAIKYQAIARNSSGEVIANQNVSFRISIMQGSAQGNTVYQEIQAAATNQFGLANLSIGQGNVVAGIFDSIQWGNGTYFAKIEFDPTGGSNFAIMGISQLLSVPYSLYSAHAKVADNMPVFPLKAALQATNLQTPFNEPETGLLVYNTDSAGAGIFSVIPGYYYNAGTATDPKWVLLSTANNFPHPLPPDNCAWGGDNSFGCSAGPGSSPSGWYNTGYGYDALLYLSSGYDNTAYGNGALADMMTGGQNTAVGSLALADDNSSGGDVAIGYEALVNADGDNFNTAIGYKSMYNMNLGINNVATGTGSLYGAGTPNPNSSSNVADGYAALYTNYADANTGVGDSALYSNTTGKDNSALGYQAGSANTTGNYNIAIGHLALSSGTSTGSSNTAIGDEAMHTNTSGHDNVAIGGGTLLTNTSGFYNVVIGSGAGSSNLTGNYTTGCGALALDNNTTGLFNSALGGYALPYISTGSSNTATGNNALYNNLESWNTAVGDSALASNITGTYNTALGYQADVLASGTLTNATAIGYDAKVCSSNSMLFGNGSVTTWGFGICPSNVSCTSGAIIAVNVPGATAYMDNTGSWHSCSDRNKKENFKAVDGELLLKKIDKLPITQWNYKFDSSNCEDFGAMGQVFYKILVVGNDSLTISNIDPAGIALAAIQALNRKLEAENAALKAQLIQLAQNQANEEREMAELKASSGSTSQQQASIK